MSSLFVATVPTPDAELSGRLSSGRIELKELSWPLDQDN